MELEGLLEEYKIDGCVFPVQGLFSAEHLDEIDALLSKLVADRPQVDKGDEQNLAPEDLLNLHLICKEVLDLCREPKVLQVAARILGTEDLSVFTSRILCKEPKTGKEIVWHQDSNYWPLTAPDNPKPTGDLTVEDVAPQVTSLWLALDPVTQRNGAMEVLPFSAQPESCQTLPKEFVVDSGGSTDGFDNFNLSLDETKLNVSKRRRVSIQRGEAEFHSAYTIHRSDANRSDVRRMAWIVRYCATGTRVVPGVRGSFDGGYQLVPLAAKAKLRLCSVSDKGEDGRVLRSIYAPCFGNAVKELKK
ncbi:unnamed protein product [Effrenium voratum]|nr:unnamed protein product [Effrenium voratum]